MNVASLGAMMDFAGTMMSRNNKSGQSAMSVLAEAFRGQGIYEINIGTNGITGKFGNGGIDVGGNVYNLAKRMSDKSNLAKYAVSNGQAKGEAAYYAYVYGDWTQENTAARIANGKDTLIFDNTNDFIARTERNAKGGRTITMADSKDSHTNAIRLGHESYRNGIIGTTAEQNAETIAAVMGHTEMAVRMEDYQSYKAQGLLGAEVEAYRKGEMTSLFMNAIANYDSSEDYWRVTKDATGKIIRVQDDGDNSVFTVVNENGSIEEIKLVTSGSFTQQLANMTDEKQSKSDINDLISSQINGLDFNKTKGWHSINENGIYKGTSEVSNILRNFLSVVKNNYEKNTDIQLYQEDIEEKLELPLHSACAILASAEMNNKYLETLMMNPSLSNTSLLTSLISAKGTMFTDKSWVQSFNGLNARLSQAVGYDDYLVFSRFYNSVEALETDNVQYYLIKASEIGNPTHTHFMMSANGQLFDPDKTTHNRWWENNSTKIYYGFRPKYQGRK